MSATTTTTTTTIATTTATATVATTTASAPVTRLVLKPKKARKQVVWAEDVVDNEGAGKKSSKICCVYHKPRAFGESSSEDSSDCECGN